MSMRSAAAAGATQPQPQPPEEFRCPISLELMADPVIVSTGQSYDRESIQRWLDAGHRSCPKTKQQLESTVSGGEVRLIPNFALRSIIHRWAAAHRIPLPDPAGAPPRAAAREEGGREVELVRALKSGDGAAVRDAIREVRSLANEGRRQRAALAEAGGVAAILGLLLREGGTPKVDDYTRWRAEVEENAVVALLNLSAADDAAKVGLVAEGALEAIVAVLQRETSSGDTLAVAALAVASLAMVEVNKATIGRRPEVTAALVRVVAGASSSRARKDAAVAVHSLAMLPDNRPRIVAAGAIDVLIGSMLGSGAAPIRSPEEEERTLALLDVLAACAQGRDAIRRRRRWRAAAAVLVAALAPGRSDRSRESGAAVLAAVVEGGGGDWAEEVRNAGAAAHLRDMVAWFAPGSRPARKASKLLQSIS